MPDPIPPVPPPPGVGLINSGTVTGYTPATATAATAAATSYNPEAFTVSPKATVAGQLKDILDSDSPLLEQAEAGARQAMSGRGLINSSMALSAGRKALYDTALPIAASDAATFDRAATNTTTAANRGLEFGATATNTAALANAAAETQTSQFNAGQQNVALGETAKAANTFDLARLQREADQAIARLNADTTLSVADKQTQSAQIIARLQTSTALEEARMQIQGSKDIQTMQSLAAKELERIRSDTTLSVADKDIASRQLIADLQARTEIQNTRLQIEGSKDVAELQGALSKELERIKSDNQLTLADKARDTQELLANINKNTTLAVADKDAASRQAIATLQAETDKEVSKLQADTTLTEQQRAIEAQKALQGMQDTLNRELARIQQDTTLSVADKQSATQRIIALGNNETARAVQQLQNVGALANIRANGEVSTKLADIDGRYKLLIQNSAGAAQIWSNALQFMNNVVQNPDINPEQKTEYLNNKVQEVNDALEMQSRIAGTPQVSSLLNYSLVGNDQGGGSARGTLTPATSPLPTTSPPAPANDNTAAIQNLYSSVLGRGADEAGLNYWKQQAANGMPLSQIEASMKASDEYKRMTGTG